jgi:hypothetical protein
LKQGAAAPSVDIKKLVGTQQRLTEVDDCLASW